MKTQAIPSLSFADLLDPAALSTRSDADGAEIILSPVQAAAHDVVLDAEARRRTDREWDELAAMVLKPEFAETVAALCAARAVEARRIANGGRQ